MSETIAISAVKFQTSPRLKPAMLPKSFACTNAGSPLGDLLILVRNHSSSSSTNTLSVRSHNKARMANVRREYTGMSQNRGGQTQRQPSFWLPSKPTLKWVPSTKTRMHMQYITRLRPRNIATLSSKLLLPLYLLKLLQTLKMR